jgi:hypothetical protein
MERFRRTILLAVLALAGHRLLYGQDPPPLFLPPPPEVEFGNDSQFEHGQPNRIIDGVGWAFGIPKKIILWDRRAVNHRVSAETQRSLAQYLATNGVVSTKVRINQYDPFGEWQRLRANKEVGAGWRYTVGAFGTITYTLLPGRLFGADRYNPYTDSVYIYSDIPCIALEQASRAKLIQVRAHPGTYAAFTSLPVVRLWPSKQSKQDVLDYTIAYGTAAEQIEATKILYAEFGAEMGGQASLFVGSNLPLTLVGAGIGHITAHHYAIASSEESPEALDSELTARKGTETGTETRKR